MKELELPPLDEDVRMVLQGASKVEPAPEGVRTRVRDRVEALVAPPGGWGDGGTGGDSSPARGKAHPARPSAGPSRLQRLLQLALSFALGSGLTAVAMRHRTESPPSSIEPSHAMALAPRPLPAAEQSADPGPSPSPLPAAPSSPRPSAIARGPLPVTPDRFTAERQLLDRARSLLEREEPAAALEVTARHEHAYPTGALVQEREAMAIRALIALGRTSDARARAERFRARFPDSLLLPTIEASLTSGRLP